MLMWLGFFKEYTVSLIFLVSNLLSLSTTFGSQLKLWSASKQCFTISFFSQSQFLTDLLCSSERDLKDRLVYKVDWCFTITVFNFVNDIVFIFCSYSFSGYKGVYSKCFQCKKWIFFCKIWVNTVVSH